MKIYKNGEEVFEYTPSYSGKKIVVAIDSSKSNSAIAVSDTNGNILDDYEIAGGGSDVDVYDLCWYTRKQLTSLFEGADIQLVGIENIITKNEKGYKGIEIHQSRYKITAVFDNFIFFFQDRHNIMPKLVNNQEWKAGVLPEEYRKRDHKKGSKDWFRALGNRWADRKDDVTDVICILMYILKTVKLNPVYDIKETAPPNNKYDVGIFPKNIKLPKESKQFNILNGDTLEHNLDAMSNYISAGQYGYVKLPIEKIPIEWIYSDKLKYSNEFKYDRNTDEVILAVYLL